MQLRKRYEVNISNGNRELLLVPSVGTFLSHIFQLRG